MGVMTTLITTATLGAALARRVPAASTRFRPPAALAPASGSRCFAASPRWSARRWRPALVLAAAAHRGLRLGDLAPGALHRPAGAAAGRRPLGRGRAAAGRELLRGARHLLGGAARARPWTRRSTAPPRRGAPGGAAGAEGGDHLPRRLAGAGRPASAAPGGAARRSPWSGRRTICARELAAAGFRLDPFAAALETLRALGQGEDPGAPPLARVAALDVGAGAPGGLGGPWSPCTCGSPWASGAGVDPEALARELARFAPRPGTWPWPPSRGSGGSCATWR